MYVIFYNNAFVLPLRDTPIYNLLNTNVMLCYNKMKHQYKNVIAVSIQNKATRGYKLYEISNNLIAIKLF